MIVRPTSRSVTNRTMPSTSVAAMSALTAMAAVASFPGAQ